MEEFNFKRPDGPVTYCIRMTRQEFVEHFLGQVVPGGMCESCNTTLTEIVYVILDTGCICQQCAAERILPYIKYQKETVLKSSVTGQRELVMEKDWVRD